MIRHLDLFTMRPLDEDEMKIWWWLYRNVQQFKMEPGVYMAEDVEKIEQITRKLWPKSLRKGSVCSRPLSWRHC
ncbi:MAG: hypothetical protein NZX77_03240 [Polyangiaceae bacterium]|nr:hypothetical protein [Polyangiaceae bacterium]